MSMMYAEDQMPVGTPGGAATAGFNVRHLNTIIYNSIGAILTNDSAAATVPPYTVALPAGTYFLDASSPAYSIGRHQLDIICYCQEGVVRISGESAYAEFDQTVSRARGVVTSAALFVIKLFHFIETARGRSNGLGIAAGVNAAVPPTHETYSTLRAEKLS